MNWSILLLCFISVEAKVWCGLKKLSTQSIWTQSNESDFVSPISGKDSSFFNNLVLTVLLRYISTVLIASCLSLDRAFQTALTPFDSSDTRWAVVYNNIKSSPNLTRALFTNRLWMFMRSRQNRPSFSWALDVNGSSIALLYLCQKMRRKWCLSWVFMMWYLSFSFDDKNTLVLVSTTSCEFVLLSTRNSHHQSTFLHKFSVWNTSMHYFSSF